ncbi:MAG: hypothetical protein ACYCT1_08405 [Steroidobacteraceae bacterium]
MDLFALVGWDLEAEVRKIAQLLGVDEGLLQGIAKSVALGAAAAPGLAAALAGASEFAAGSASGAAAGQSVASFVPTTWAVGAVLPPLSGHGTRFTALDPSGASLPLQPSVLSTYDDAPVVFSPSGQHSSIASVTTASGVVTVELNEQVPIASGQTLRVYSRPPGVDVSGTQRAQTTQVYVGILVATVPAGSTAAVTLTDQFRPEGMAIETHRGQVFVISAKGYSYTVQVQLLLGAPGLQPVAQSPQLSTTAGFGGWQVFGIAPPAVSNVVTYTVTPDAAGADDDTVTLLWFLDGNDSAIDQDPTGAYPLQVSGLPTAIAGGLANGSDLLADDALFSSDFAVPSTNGNGTILLSVAIDASGSAVAMQETHDGGTTWWNLRRGRAFTPGDRFDLAMPVKAGQSWNVRVKGDSVLGFVEAQYVRDI